MKLNATKFGKSSVKLFAEPNRPKPTEPRTEPNRNFGRFLVLIIRSSYINTSRACSRTGKLKTKEVPAAVGKTNLILKIFDSEHLQ